MFLTFVVLTHAFMEACRARDITVANISHVREAAKQAATEQTTDDENEAVESNAASGYHRRMARCIAD